MKKKLANMSQNLFLLRTHIRIKVRHEYENAHKAEIRTKKIIRRIEF